MALRWFLLLLCVYRVMSWNESSREDCHFNEKPYFFGTDYSEQLIVYPEEEHTINFCKPTNYCYIEWYRDDKEINMTDDGRVKSLDSKHEVLKLSYPLSSDSGIFKCVAWNNMGSVERHANVIVYTKREVCMDIHFELHESESGSLVVGKPYQKMWYATMPGEQEICFFSTPNSTAIPFCSDEQQADICADCSRNSSNTKEVLATLRFSQVTEEDLSGTYTLTLANECDEGIPYHKIEFVLRETAQGPVEVDSPPIISLVFGIVFITFLCILSWSLIGVDLQLFIKDNLGKPEVSDGRSYDAYISYAWSDVDRLFVLCLKSTLEKRGYRVYVPEIDNVPGGCTAVQLVEALQQSRRFIMVLSPEYVRANFTSYEVNISLEVVNNYKDYIIPVVFQGLDLPDHNAIFRHIMKVTQTVKWSNIEWPISDQYESNLGRNHSYCDKANLASNRQKSKVSMEKSFMKKGYKELLLKLPPRPKPRPENNAYLLL
ncbi:uncharacterized protein [Apostichopus japonicus]|uniref:uncharacterized protein n=1 Tax=Stichopus japonicus TaxID=307972 RepID=UPI003AB2F9CA